MNFDNLKTMTREQLMELAGKQGIHVHHKANEATIIKLITEQALAPQPPVAHPISASSVAGDDDAEFNDDVFKYGEKVAVTRRKARLDRLNTADMVEAALAKIKERQPKFESRYNLDDNTWHFRCLGTEDSGNIAIPLRVIVMKATNIARGRIAPRALNDDFDKINTSPKNAYTNTVLG